MGYVRALHQKSSSHGNTKSSFFSETGQLSLRNAVWDGIELLGCQLLFLDLWLGYPHLFSLLHSCSQSPGPVDFVSSIALESFCFYFHGCNPTSGHGHLLGDCSGSDWISTSPRLLLAHSPYCNQTDFLKCVNVIILFPYFKFITSFPWSLG